MTRLPRLRSAAGVLLLALLVGVLTVSVPRASAIDPFPNDGILTLSSEHFKVHYDRNDRSLDCAGRYITQQKAGDVLGMAERAYALYRSWGYPAPILDSGDGDALLDISVDQFSVALPTCTTFGTIVPSIPRELDGTLSRWDALINPTAPTGAGEMHLDPAKSLTYHFIAHQLFHLFQRAVYPAYDEWLDPDPSIYDGQWLGEGTAEWAAVRAESALGGGEQSAARTMDCVGTECGDTEFDRNGYPGWLLFEYLAERYGDSAVKAVWDRAAEINDPDVPATTDLADVLATHGKSLTSFFNDYATARLTGSFTFALLAGTLPVTQLSVAVPQATGALPTGLAAVNHLATKYVALQHGDTGGPCYAASLSINVAVPASVVSAPSYYANTKDATAQALTVSGSNASITVPWNTCTGSPDAYLSLPNATWPGLDGREFVVTGTVTVDKTTPATASEPPARLPVHGSVVETPTSDPAPTLTLHAPEVLRVSAKTRLLRFVVFSSGAGSLRATLGSTSLGTATVRTGANDLRFKLPVSTVVRLRTKSLSNLLTLTSLAGDGAAGKTVTRRVSIKLALKKKTAKKKTTR